MTFASSFTEAVSSLVNDPIGTFEKAAGIGFIQEATQNLRGQMDVTQSLRQSVEGETATGLVLDSVGRDVLVFLAASVLVTPVSKRLGITTILGYLIVGALLGPSGADIFSNSEADLELGDFGIVFLLFSEGLEVSAERLRSLASYLPLGLAQLSLTALVLSATMLLRGPQFLDRFLPLDTGLIDIRNPAEVLVLALALALSTSAFAFPVLKEKGWDSDRSGQAATSILLLQDLAVAPLLVVMPFIVGQGLKNPVEIILLTLKATVGFGSVLAAGSFFLRRLFALIAETRSSETFVALCLLVSAGTGATAKNLGLTDTAGAFAAGVLLANSNYRAQIQADILPFKGILLGIFFMVAGSSFDLELALRDWPTIVTGALGLILLKAGTLFAATRVPRWLEPNRLPMSDAVRLSLLLSGGGEFAFVVLALAEKLKVLPKDLGSLLAAIVLTTMAVTPLLGELGERLARKMPPVDVTAETLREVKAEASEVAPDAVVVCGWGEIGRAVSARVDEMLAKSRVFREGSLPQNVAFTTRDPAVCELLGEGTVVLFGDGGNPSVLKASGVEDPRAIFVTYMDHERCVSACSRLRAAFEDAPIYTRAQTRSEALELREAGATEVVVEFDELPRSCIGFLRGSHAAAPSKAFEEGSLIGVMRAVATAHGFQDESRFNSLVELYNSMDADADGTVDREEVLAVLGRSQTGIKNDTELLMLTAWLDGAMANKAPGRATVDFGEFCRLARKLEEYGSINDLQVQVQPVVEETTKAPQP